MVGGRDSQQIPSTAKAGEMSKRKRIRGTRQTGEQDYQPGDQGGNPTWCYTVSAAADWFAEVIGSWVMYL